MAQNLELALRVRSQMQEALRDLDRLERDLKGVGDEGRGAGAGLGSMAGQARGLRNAIAGLGVAALVRSLVQANTQAQSSQAVIRTLTGSVGEAAAVWQELLGFASETPFTLDQSVNAFKALKARGLDPGIDALRAYADFAAAMGRDLTQFVEAVADAATGEFERLKEFGVIARQEGNQVAFTFQGVTTTVEKNAQAIEQFLQGIARSNFGGAAATQMETLGGQTSNLQDNFTKLGLAIGEAGANRAFADLLGVMSSGVETLTEHIDDLAPIITVVASALAGRLAQGAAASAAQMLAAGSAAGALRAAMALLGGPAGTVAIVAGGLIGYIATLENTEEKTKRLAGETDKLRIGLEKISKLQAQNRFNQAQEQIEETTAALVQQARLIETLEKQRSLNAANPAAFPFDPADLTAARAAEEDLQRVLRDQINTRRDLQAVIDGTFQAEQKAAAGSVGGTQAVNAEYEKLLASLREQAETMGLVGEAARVRYQIETGALGKLDAAQQANLLRYAEQIDAQERAAKSRDDAGTRAEEAAQRALASMEEEIALQGQIRSGSAQISEEARIRYEIESGAYRQASAATQQQLLEQARLIDAIRATAGVRRELESITERASGATDRYRDIQDALRIALDEGLISQQRYNAELAVATREYQAAVDPIREMNREIDEQVRLLQLSSREREIEAQMVRARDRLAAQGTSFDAQPGSEDAMRNRLEQLQALNEASDRQETMVRIADSLPGADPQMDYAIIVAGELNRLWQETAGTLLGLNARLLAVDKAWAAGAITLDHYRRLLAEVNIEAATVLNEMSAGNSLTILVQALGHVVEGFKSVQSSLADILGSGLAEWADGLSNGIARAVIQGDSLRDTLYDIATNVATEMLAQFIKMGIQMAVIRMLAGSNLTGSINGLVMGAAQNALQFNPSDIFRGMFGGLAGGGQVLGPGTTTSDSILAALSHKEFVTRAAVVMQPGALNFLEDFNARGMAALRDWSAVHHATGGLAGVPAPAFPAPSAEVSLAEPGGARVDNNFRFVNVFDVEDVSRRVTSTGTFEKQVLNIVGSNPSAIRQRLGL